MSAFSLDSISKTETSIRTSFSAPNAEEKIWVFLSSFFVAMWLAIRGGDFATALRLFLRTVFVLTW